MQRIIFGLLDTLPKQFGNIAATESKPVPFKNVLLEKFLLFIQQSHPQTARLCRLRLLEKFLLFIQQSHPQTARLCRLRLCAGQDKLLYFWQIFYHISLAGYLINSFFVSAPSGIPSLNARALYVYFRNS
jgi:hypothetical protein